jgi:hypothetical protein
VRFADVRINVRLSYRPGLYDPGAIQHSLPGITAQLPFNLDGDAIADIEENQIKQEPPGTDFAEKLLCKAVGMIDRRDMRRTTQQAWFNVNLETPKR